MTCGSNTQRIKKQKYMNSRFMIHARRCPAAWFRGDSICSGQRGAQPEKQQGRTAADHHGLLSKIRSGFEQGLFRACWRIERKTKSLFRNVERYYGMCQGFLSVRLIGAELYASLSEGGRIESFFEQADGREHSCVLAG